MGASDTASNIRKLPQTPENFQDVLDKAASFEELGLTIDAVAEYKKLIPTRYPPAKIVPRFVACLSKTNSTSKIIQKIEEFVSQSSVSKNRLAQFRVCHWVLRSTLGTFLRSVALNWASSSFSRALCRP